MHADCCRAALLGEIIAPKGANAGLQKQQQNSVDAHNSMNSATSIRGSHLLDLIELNGTLREEERSQVQFAQGSGHAPEGSFGADLIFQEESGFELWLGSLDDALSLDALQKRHINAFLNCASEECDRECASFRKPVRGSRSRSHARGPSASHDRDIFTCASAVDGHKTLAADQVKAAASFDDEWYSDTLGYSTAYLAIPANDNGSYLIDRHFPEIVTFLDSCRQERRRVLVHCVMGVNRSSAALAAFLCEGLGVDLEESIITISRRRGHILTNRSFLDQLVVKYGLGHAKTTESARSAAVNLEQGGNPDSEVETTTGTGGEVSESSSESQ
mmetsp:Transcript_98266/g.194676  ORF Transcript_98266/g.194676 Transcript_98266/m.194676 type:complete len:331 (+) Transcript_98266:48-1040(+)